MLMRWLFVSLLIFAALCDARSVGRIKRQQEKEPLTSSEIDEIISTLILALEAKLSSIRTSKAGVAILKTAAKESISSTIRPSTAIQVRTKDDPPSPKPKVITSPKMKTTTAATLNPDPPTTTPTPTISNHQKLVQSLSNPGVLPSLVNQLTETVFNNGVPKLRIRPESDENSKAESASSRRTEDSKSESSKSEDSSDESASKPAVGLNPRNGMLTLNTGNNPNLPKFINVPIDSIYSALAGMSVRA